LAVSDREVGKQQRIDAGRWRLASILDIQLSIGKP
jgi:hypothetical protein